MDIRRVRQQLRQGASLYDLPLRVTFYARVSTDKEEQASSLSHQVQYYTKLIADTPPWLPVAGYVDEGISGTSTRHRDSFNRMIADAQKGCFDFILTKEISRFSRSTLDSILYTQQLLEQGVGVLFQNDNINTLDPDSEFRLVVMAGVAQDEVRKLSQRLKFGFHQSIQNGRVLGNDTLWGYDKSDGKLRINASQAPAVRLIFELYATGQYGIRKLSQELLRRGFTSRQGNAFNERTIRQILQNPKYKGWYCGNKSKSVDYRRHKTLQLEQEEWVMYPDPNIPALVSESLWDAANALYRQRGSQIHTPGACFANRYGYSGKLICQQHQAPMHRQVYRGSGGEETECWRCSVYRRQGPTGCDTPAVRTRELDLVLEPLGRQILSDGPAIERWLLGMIRQAGTDWGGDTAQRIERQVRQLEAKKEKLLELCMQGAVDTGEFQQRNRGYNRQIAALQQDLPDAPLPSAAVEPELKQLLREGTSDLWAAMVQAVVVKQGSDRRWLRLEIRLKNGWVGSCCLDRREKTVQYDAPVAVEATGAKP